MGFSLPGMTRAEITTSSPGSTLDPAVVVHRDARKGGHGLALAAGENQRHLVSGHFLDVLRRDEQAVRDPQFAQPHRDLGILEHAAPYKAKAASVFKREFGDNLQTVQGSGEATD